MSSLISGRGGGRAKNKNTKRGGLTAEIAPLDAFLVGLAEDVAQVLFKVKVVGVRVLSVGRDSRLLTRDFALQFSIARKVRNRDALVRDRPSDVVVACREAALLLRDFGLLVFVQAGFAR